MNILDAQLTAILACPVCKGELALADESLICTPCRLRFRIHDGIPILLVGEAEHIDPNADCT